MSRYHSYIKSASGILDSYNGEVPFGHFIKKQFALNKKFGSRDRKMISALCYHYFRTFHVFKNETTEQKILKGIFIIESNSNEILKELNPVLNENITGSSYEKFSYLNVDITSVFPFASALGNEIDPIRFAHSFLIQPLLYLRLRPGKQNTVIKKLSQAQIEFKQPKDNCIALQNATSLEDILKLNREAVVQDFNSQSVFDFPENIVQLSSGKKRMTVWDCCAASGGKSILMYDKMHGNVQLTVSDIRKSILHNLQQRLQDAGVPVYKTFEADLMKGIPAERDDHFDMIICDVPCTGSGTWSRTPEQAVFFKAESINEFSLKQQTIAGNAVSLLKKDGLFFYITCSVFKKENELVVDELLKKHSLKLLSMQYLRGYEIQADTMFVAVLQK